MNIQNGATVPAGSACLQMLELMIFTERQMEQIRAAGVAYRHLFELRGTSPEWASAHAEWQGLAETIAIALVKQVERTDLVATHDAITKVKS